MIGGLVLQAVARGEDSDTPGEEQSNPFTHAGTYLPLVFVFLLLIPLVLLVAGVVDLRRKRHRSALWMGRVSLVAGPIWMAIGATLGRKGWRDLLSWRIPETMDAMLPMGAGILLLVTGFYLWRSADRALAGEREAAEDRRLLREHRADLRGTGEAKEA